MKKEIIKLENVVLLILVITLSILVFAVTNGNTINFDNAIYNLLKHNDILTTLMKILTNFGDIVFLLPATILLLMVFKNKKDAVFIPINLIVISVLNLIFKSIICRPRPEGIALVKESGYSFPSGHSSVSLVFYGFLIYLMLTKVKDKKIRNIFTIVLSILILTIGISRIYLKVHFASDVLGGFIFGGIVLILLLKCYRNKSTFVKTSKK